MVKKCEYKQIIKLPPFDQWRKPEFHGKSKEILAELNDYERLFVTADWPSLLKQKVAEALPDVAIPIGNKPIRTCQKVFILKVAKNRFHGNVLKKLLGQKGFWHYQSVADVQAYIDLWR